MNSHFWNERYRAEQYACGRALATRVEIVLIPASGLPEKYREAIIRAAEHCSVKKSLVSPPIDVRRHDPESFWTSAARSGRRVMAVLSPCSRVDRPETFSRSRAA
ncbi:MAG: hypothetical protein RLZZ450_4736 [Pseudomonadota bacterium]|jgi:hypothetical protein